MLRSYTRTVRAERIIYYLMEVDGRGSGLRAGMFQCHSPKSSSSEADVLAVEEVKVLDGIEFSLPGS